MQEQITIPLEMFNGLIEDRVSISTIKNLVKNDLGKKSYKRLSDDDYRSYLGLILKIEDPLEDPESDKPEY